MTVTVDFGDKLNEGHATVRLPRMTDTEFYEFCRRNPLLNVERNAEGDLVLMAPSDAWTESRGCELLADLGIWNRGLTLPGYVFGSSGAFKLPNGADRSPSGAWVARARWEAIPSVKRSPFPHVAPDFVVEVMSPSDRLAEAQRKMEEYQASGVRLGWLIDRKRRTVTVYRPAQEPAEIIDPATPSGDPELPGFIADLARVFLPDTHA